jgi:hypothetical protein
VAEMNTKFVNVNKRTIVQFKIVLIYYFFNTVVHRADYIATNSRISDSLHVKDVDAVTAQFDILPQHILGVTEKNNNLLSEELVAGPKFET